MSKKRFLKGDVLQPRFKRARVGSYSQSRSNIEYSSRNHPKGFEHYFIDRDQLGLKCIICMLSYSFWHICLPIISKTLIEEALY